MISARQLAVGYDGVAILENLDFEVPRGSIFAVLGRSGCGKSTLMRSLVGLEQPISGSIHVDGIGAPHLDDKRPSSGVMFQQGALFSSLTLLANVALPLRTWTDLSEQSIEDVANARLRLVGLGGFENHLPDEISGGMRKRASIARALALDPELLFLDEPSAGLDPVTAAELDGLIASLRDNLRVTTIIVTHELLSIFRIADQCIMLDRDARGMIVQGDPRELRDTSDDERVHAFFNPNDKGSNG